MLESNPNEKWNQFVDLLAMEGYKDLTEIQKVDHLCFWYDSELQNVCHLQYFFNRGISLITKTALALMNLGTQLQIIIYTKAINILQTEGISNIKRVEVYVAEAFEGKFDDVDSKYYNCVPTIHDLLEKYLEKYEKEFLFYGMNKTGNSKGYRSIKRNCYPEF